MNITIRDLHAGDFANGFLETLANLAEVKLTRDEAVEVFQKRLRTGVRTFVAEADGKIVGTVSLIVEQKFIHTGGKVGHIEDVVVHRDHQKKGIAGDLVRHALEEAKKIGCYKVILDCFENLTEFYAKFGFRKFNVGMRVDLGK